MYLFRRLLPFLTSASSAVLLYVYVSKFFLSASGTGIGVIIGAHLALLTLSMVALGAFHPLPTRLRFLSFPFAVTVGAYVQLSFMEHTWASLGLTALVAAMIWIWYETLYSFWQQPVTYSPYALQRLGLPLYTIVVFLAFAAMSGVHIYLQMRLWGIMAVAGIVLACILYDSFALSHFSGERTLVASGLGLILGMEIFAVLNAMPGQIYISAVLMAILFYIWVGITRLWAQNELKKAFVMPYVFVAGAGFLLTVTSTLWII